MHQTNSCEGPIRHVVDIKGLLPLENRWRKVLEITTPYLFISLYFNIIYLYLYSMTSIPRYILKDPNFNFNRYHYDVLAFFV